ncbi:hypothetical protein J2W30_002754 [Variovorax boronicumulans]|uniref:hypothetical protein n=1 Tax=Variovorax boronicumulans TaxID=436515 RepID=UPI0027860716|nr:hypothetical protein [Variovorax boronicumulans]MDQ0034998.1 hypothetical protein [Variovorax boronicumulans]
MRHTLLHYLSTQRLPATVAGAQGIAAVQALLMEGCVKAVLPSKRSGEAGVPVATVTELTRLGHRALRRFSGA